MKRATISLLVILVFPLALAGAARGQSNDDADRCYQASLEGSSISLDLGIHYCTRAIQSGQLSDENLAITFNNRGSKYTRKGEFNRAIRDYDQAILLKPDYENAFANRCEAYAHSGEPDRAMQDCNRAISLNPDNEHAFNDRGHAYLTKGDFDRAIRDFDQALRLHPGYRWALGNKALALNGKAWKLATSDNAYERDGHEAVRLAQEAVRLQSDPNIRDTLAAAYVESGRFADAIAEQQRAIEMLKAAGQHDQVTDYQTRLDLYRNRQPYRE